MTRNIPPQSMLVSVTEKAVVVGCTCRSKHWQKTLVEMYIQSFKCNLHDVTIDISFKNASMHIEIPHNKYVYERIQVVLKLVA